MEPNPTDLSRLKIDRKEKQTAWRSAAWTRKIEWVGLFLLIVVALVLSHRFLMPSAKRVEVATVSYVSPLEGMTLLNASGYVVAQRKAAVASKGTGRLVDLRAKEGDLVRQGEIIARLESADMAAALSQAQANLKVARSAYDQAQAEFHDATLSYERKKSLLASGLIPRAEFDAVEARYLTARAAVASADAGIRAVEAAVRAAEVDLENTNIRAPFDGTVLTKNAEVGEVVAPFGSSSLAKAAVVTIADMGSLQIEADVSESNIEKVYIGQRCEITLDAYPVIQYKGIVDTIVPTVDRAKATVLTKIRFTNLDQRILPEMSAKVSFLSRSAGETEAKRVVAVHPAAVLLKEGRRVAFLIRDNRVDEVTIEVGEPVGILLEIKEGLQPGNQVVMNPPEDLAGGDRIQIR